MPAGGEGVRARRCRARGHTLLDRLVRALPVIGSALEQYRHRRLCALCGPPTESWLPRCSGAEPICCCPARLLRSLLSWGACEMGMEQGALIFQMISPSATLRLLAAQLRLRRVLPAPVPRRAPQRATEDHRREAQRVLSFGACQDLGRTLFLPVMGLQCRGRIIPVLYACARGVDRGCAHAHGG